MSADPVALLTALRATLAEARDRFDAAANRAAASHALREYGLQRGKEEGVSLAITFVDDALRQALS